MKLLALAFALFLCFLNIYSQQVGPNISFDNESHNFGKIEEIKGPVSFVFNFTNTGSEPLVLQNVQPSCGCTTPEWTHEPVKAGEKGYVKATFNPTGRPGHFDKSINVTSNALRNPIILKFSGEVIPKPPTLTDKFPFAIDKVRFSSLYIAYGKLAPGKTYTRALEVVNTASEVTEIAFTKLPSHLKVKVTPAKIRNNEKAVIEFVYDPAKKNDWGFINDVVDYTLNGKQDAKYRININGIIEDDYSNATADELAKAPKIILKTNSFDFGKISAGTSIEAVFNLENKGKSNLIIHKISTSCGCTVVKSKENIIKPGASSQIVVTFNSTGQKGLINKSITVITNDPQSLNMVLWVKGTVN
jgi:hypothetical protein